VVYNILLQNYKNIQFLTRKFQKNKFYASFQFYFMYVLLVKGDIVSKHEQLLILTYIDTSILCCGHLLILGGS
jgi:hypothetical protein